MAYDLWVDGLRDVDRVVRLFNKQQRSREPLSGIVDGVNQYFYAQTTPILSSGSVSLYTSGSSPLSPTDYTLDSLSGLFTLNTAPSVQPTATFMTARYPESTVRSILVAGFDEMEGRWYRGLCLSESTGSGVFPITEDSLTAYITDSSGSAPYSINGVPFERSRAQVNFYVRCAQLAYLKSLLPESALFGYIWSEYGGLKVDKSMTTKNLKLALDAIEGDLNRAQQQAQLEWFGNTVFGGGIAPLYTPDFVTHRWWQKKSQQEDTRNTMQYIGDRW